jgi:outer membrane protein assembly factor BamE (lipoprotein component of BamABCDE complex)
VTHHWPADLHQPVRSNDWYYVSRNTAQRVPHPKVTEQTVLRVQFDQAGNVVSVQSRQEQIAKVDPSGDKT